MISLETMFCDERFFGVTEATPCQRAICRICEGLPLGELAQCDDVREMVGGQAALDILTPGNFRPKEVDVLAAIRSGKSRFIAAHCAWSTQIVDVSKLKAGETPRYPVLSVNLTSARATFRHLAGTIADRPLLRALLVSEPVGEVLYLKHPSGRPIECAVASGNPGQSNLVSDWLAGFAAEEFTRQQSEASGARVNLEDAYRTVAGRILDGGQIISAGAPWAPLGPSFDRFSAYFGKPSVDRVILKATGPMLNPSHWTPQRCDDLSRSNPDAYITDVLAGFRDPVANHLAMVEVRDAQRVDALFLPPATNRKYFAVCDPATRGNDFALMILGGYLSKEDNLPRYEIALYRRWQGSTAQPIMYGIVLQEIRKVLGQYGLRDLHGDQHNGDAIREIAGRYGMAYWIHTVKPGNEPEPLPGQSIKKSDPFAVYKNDGYEMMKTLFSERTISIPRDPRLVTDLLSIRRKVTTNSVTYELPHTADGRHADYASCLALGLSLYPSNADTRVAVSRTRHLTKLWAGMALTGNAEEIPELRAAGYSNPGYSGPSRDVYARVMAGMSLEEASKPTFVRTAESHGFAADSLEPIDNPGACVGQDEVLWNELLAGKRAADPETGAFEVDAGVLAQTGDPRIWANEWMDEGE